MTIRRLVPAAAALIAVTLCTYAVHRYTAETTLALPASPIRMDKPLAAPRLTSNQAIAFVRANTNGVLLHYAQSVQTQYGSYNLNLYRKRTDSRGLPLPPIERITPTKDYWAVSLYGLYKDSSGTDLLILSNGPEGHKLNPYQNITYVIDDTTGKIATFSMF